MAHVLLGCLSTALGAVVLSVSDAHATWVRRSALVLSALWVSFGVASPRRWFRMAHDPDIDVNTLLTVLLYGVVSYGTSTQIVVYGAFYAAIVSISFLCGVAAAVRKATATRRGRYMRGRAV